MQRYTPTIVLAAMLLAGCVVSNPARQKGVSAGSALDSFCTSAEKRSWDLTDSGETILQAEAWNDTIDRRCGAKGKS